MKHRSRLWLFGIFACACVCFCAEGCGGNDSGEGTSAVIVFSPHPDDESIMAAATLHRAAMDPRTTLYAVFLSSGNANGVPGPCHETSVEEKERKIVEHREREARNAWAVIGGDPSRILFLRYPDKGLVAQSTFSGGRHVDTLTEAGEAAFAEATDLLPRLVPEDARSLTLITASVWDAHPDHRTAYRIAMAAGRSIREARRIPVTVLSGIVHDEFQIDLPLCCIGDVHWPNRGPELDRSALLDLPQRPRPPLWNTNLDVSDLTWLRAEALSQHASQVYGYLPLCMIAFKPYFDRWMEKTVESFYAETP